MTHVVLYLVYYTLAYPSFDPSDFFARSHLGVTVPRILLLEYTHLSHYLLRCHCIHEKVHFRRLTNGEQCAYVIPNSSVMDLKWRYQAVVWRSSDEVSWPYVLRIQCDALGAGTEAKSVAADYRHPSLEADQRATHNLRRQRVNSNRADA